MVRHRHKKDAHADAMLATAVGSHCVPMRCDFVVLSLQLHSRNTVRMHRAASP